MSELPEKRYLKCSGSVLVVFYNKLPWFVCKLAMPEKDILCKRSIFNNKLSWCMVVLSERAYLVN